jgi:D-amino-acid dehydrogenase
MATKAKSVVIVGGGVIGLCTAYYAAQKGHSVTVVERGAPNHDSCSLGNAGMVVPSHFIPLAAPGMPMLGLRMLFNPESPFHIHPRLNGDLFDWAWKFFRAANPGHVSRSAPLLRDMNLESRRSYEELAAESGNTFGLAQKGLLMLCKSEHTLHEESSVAEQAKKLGLIADVLTPAQAAERDPGIRMDIAGAIHFVQDCHLSPQRFVAGLTERLEREGVRFHWSTEITAWQVKDGKVTGAKTSSGEELTADEYVLAGGVWSGETVRRLGLRLPLQAGKGYSMTLPKPRQLPNLCSILTEARVAITPMGETLRVGGTMEIAGLDKAGEVNPARVRGIIKSVPQYFPEFKTEDFEGVPVWSGLRPCSPDGLPYVGRFKGYANLSTASGHAMMGLSLGPVTGKLMAAVLSDEKPAIDIALLSPDRYR